MPRETPSSPPPPWRLHRLAVELRLTAPARFHFFHGGAVHGLLATALGGHLPAGVVPVAPESGCVDFAKGEAYRLGVSYLPAAAGAVERIVAALPEVGARRPAGPPPRLGGNFTVAAVEELPAVDAAVLEREVAALAGAERLTLQLLAPLRLDRPEEAKERGAGYLNEECFPPAWFLDRLARRLARLLGEAAPAALEESAARLMEARLWWVDMPVSGVEGARPGREGGITLGGVVGRVVLAGVEPGWLPVLALGRHLHAGKGTHFALGRYLIAEGLVASPEPFRRGATLLARAAEPARLAAALDHVLEGSTAPGVDGVAPGELPPAGEAPTVEALAAELGSGAYAAAPLLGFVQRKADGGLRPLAVPTVRDRAAQRAAVGVLAPAVDTLLEDCSFAYRKGLSRAGAARAIQLAYRAGYRYVLDADVAAFFDSVEWGRLFAKLDALFPLEPLNEQLRAWVTAPVVFEATRIERRHGLPQGAAVSPLLANLFLDEFDEELLGRDFRLVRYADDFVVLAKELEEALAAREAAREALAELGLELHEGKTDIRSIDDGFTYLGYLFCRSLVIEQKERKKVVDVPLTPEAIPPRSWLAQVPFARLRELREVGRGRKGGSGIEAVTLLSVTPAQRLDARPLYVARWDARLSVRGGTLRVELPHEETLAVPLRGLSHVAFVGRTQATVASLLALARHGVPSFFTTRTGRLYATFAATPSDWRAVERQVRAAADEERCASFAREVVAAKLRNQAAVAVRHKLRGYGEASRELRELAKAALNKASLETLRGLEGKGAALFFEALRAHLSPDWGFYGRRKHPPTDPVNSMLSFGYTVLHCHASAALTMAGLDPQIGLYHRAEGRYDALASDLQEEMRHLVDSLVIGLVHRRRVKPEDFTYPERPDTPALMTEAFRRRFLHELDATFDRRFTPPELPPMTYRDFLGVQAKQLRAYIEGKEALYRPFTLTR